MEPYTHDLSGAGWQFGRVPQRSPNEQPDDRDHVHLWRSATVPGHVHADLLDHGIIADIDVGGAVEQCRWVDGYDWWYRREVTLVLRPGARAFLHLRGIDYLADIWWNRRHLMRHEGQFVIEHLELTHDLPRDGRAHTHTLGIRLWGANAWPAPDRSILDRLWQPVARTLYDGTQSITPYHRRLGLLRNQMSFGWDFAPALLAPGIWDAAGLYVSGDVHIVNAWVRSDPDRPLLHLKLDATQPHDATIEVAWKHLSDEGDGDALRAKVDVRPGRQRVTIPLPIGDPRLWHPWEHGRPHRYRASVRVMTAGGVSDECDVSFGLRRVVWDGWQLSVNGTPVSVRGVNWVPAELLPGRLRRADYASLLHRAVDAGVHLIRVWGGGLREKRAFYELCDELGLLVWQEFPFACAFLDRYPTHNAYLDRAERTAADIVRAVRPHPSVVCWGAGNEYGPIRHRRLLRRLRRVVSLHDGTRRLHGPSPNWDEAHNWDVWHGFGPIDTYRDEDAAMVSEFGLQALPVRQTLTAVEAESDLWPPGETWKRRFGDRRKLDRYVRSVAAEEPASLDEYIRASQMAQAWGLQTMIEHQRRRRGGVIVWQFNEPWPAISWALIDHFGRPKAAFELLGRLYHPLLLSLEYTPRRYTAGERFHATLWAINDRETDVKDAEARIFQGDVSVVTMPLTMPAGMARPVHELHLTLDDPLTLRVELWRGDERVTWLEYDLGRHDAGGMPARTRVRRRLADLVMRV